MLLFSLLHTSPPLKPPPSCRSHFLCFSESSPSHSFLTYFFCFFLRLPPSLVLPLAQLPFGHAKAALCQRGHPGCPEEGKRPGSQLREERERETGTGLGPLPLSSSSSSLAPPSVCTVDVIQPTLLPRSTFTCSTCLIVCVWLWCSGSIQGGFFCSHP